MARALGLSTSSLHTGTSAQLVDYLFVAHRPNRRWVFSARVGAAHLDEEDARAARAEQYSNELASRWGTEADDDEREDRPVWDDDEQLPEDDAYPPGGSATLDDGNGYHEPHTSPQLQRPLPPRRTSSSSSSDSSSRSPRASAQSQAKKRRNVVEDDEDEPPQKKKK